ncbi:MAG: hypothetical protein ACOCVV_10660, partial [Marinobacter sp.]
MSCRLLNLRHLALASTLAALLATGCAPIQVQEDEIQTASDALSAARELSPGAETQRFLLRTAATFQERGAHDRARELLRADALDEPEDDLRDQYRLLSMESATALDDRQWAEAIAGDL